MEEAVSSGGEVSRMPIHSSLQHRGEKCVSDSGSTFRPLTAIKVRALRNVAVGSENQLHVLDNALEGERSQESVITGAHKDSMQHLLEKLSLLLLQSRTYGLMFGSTKKMAAQRDERV